MFPEEDIKQGIVQLPNSFFSKEKRSYNDWQIAWFREAIQNSVDAGAKDIRFSINQLQDSNTLRVSCADDGRGMDEDTLINVFLKMGGSKKEEGAIGGFGYAKMLLAFAHQSYNINTRNIRLVGDGGRYTWSTTDSFNEGTELIVEMSNDDCSYGSMSYALNSIISNSDLDKSIKISLNGEILTREKDPLPYRKNTKIGELTFKDLPHGYSTSTLWVRMNGLAMFKTTVWGGGSTGFEGYLELNGQSLDMLTSNRDSLNKQYDHMLSSMMDELSNDREKLKLLGEFDITLNKTAFDIDDFRLQHVQKFESVCSERKITVEALINELKAQAEAEKQSSAGDDNQKSPFLSLAKKMREYQDKMDARIQKIPADRYPKNFQVKYSDEEARESHQQAGMIAASMSKVRNAKLAAGWEALVKTLLRNENYRKAIYVDKVGDDVFSCRGKIIQCGFVYGNTFALNSEEDDEKRIGIMINPETTKDFLLGDIIDLVHHELTHIECGRHNEAFTMKDLELKRITRREIGEKALINSFESAVAKWRNEHNVAKEAPSRRQACEESGYEP